MEEIHESFFLKNDAFGDSKDFLSRPYPSIKSRQSIERDRFLSSFSKEHVI